MFTTSFGHIYPRNTTLLDDNRAAEGSPRRTVMSYHFELSTKQLSVSGTTVPVLSLTVVTDHEKDKLQSKKA